MFERVFDYMKRLWERAESDRKAMILRAVQSQAKDGILLDLGCDNGSFSKQIADAAGVGFLLGTDINLVRLRRARDIDCRVFTSDLNRAIPLGDESVDIVTADQVIEHLTDLDSFILEVYRILKPGGCAVICTENLASFHNIFSLIIGNQPYTGPSLSNMEQIGHHPLNPSFEESIAPYEVPIPRHTNVMTGKALMEIFRVKGFEVNGFIGAGFLPFPPFTWRFFLAADRHHCLFPMIKATKS